MDGYKSFGTKNKWNSQQIQKKFKNAKLNDPDGGERYCSTWAHSKKLSNFNYNEFYQDDNDEEEEEYLTSNVIPIWTCTRCTYCNIERSSHCTICQFSFYSNNASINNEAVHMKNQKEKANNNNNTTLGEYLQPILDENEIKQYDHEYIDQEMQFAIELSMKNDIITDSDDTDDNVSTNSSSFSSSSSTLSPTKRRKSKKYGKKIKKSNYSFEAYWNDMLLYNELFEQHKRSIHRRNRKKLQTESESEERKKNTIWDDIGKIGFGAFKKLKKHQELMNVIPSVDKVREWLEDEWDAKEFRIRCIVSEYTLHNFTNRGHCTQNDDLQIVYHGSYSYNDHSIIRNGLVVGGTKGVKVAHGTAYGRGVYCSPSLSTARGYQRGSLFICVVRANRCRSSGSIYVVPNDNDILPVYLASFKFDPSLFPSSFTLNNKILMFQTGWKPFNLDMKSIKQRKIKRKWSAYHKINAFAN